MGTHVRSLRHVFASVQKRRPDQLVRIRQKKVDAAVDVLFNVEPHIHHGGSHVVDGKRRRLYILLRVSIHPSAVEGILRNRDELPHFEIKGHRGHICLNSDGTNLTGCPLADVLELHDGPSRAILHARGLADAKLGAFRQSVAETGEVVDLLKLPHVLAGAANAAGVLVVDEALVQVSKSTSILN